MIPKHLKDADPWALSSFRNEKLRQRRAREEAEGILSHNLVNTANALRSALRGGLFTAAYEVRDTKKGGAWGGTGITGHPQAARCLFCKKQFAAWGGNIDRRRHKNQNWPRELMDGFSKHVIPCAEKWLRLQVARWATEQMTDEEARSFGLWRDQHAQPYISPNERSFRDDVYLMLPPELADLFDHLPSPPGTAIAMEIEIALVSVSRIWSH